MNSVVRFFSLGIIVAAVSAPAALAQTNSRTLMRVSAEVRPSCRIETSGSRTAAGWLTSNCGRENRVRIAVDGRPVAPPPASATRVSLEPGSVVQIDF